MKKLLLLTILALIGLVSPATMNASKIYTVDIDDVSRVDVDIDEVIVNNLQNGENKIEMGSARYLRVKAKDGVVFTEITFIDNYDGTESSWLDRVQMDGSRQYIDLYSSFPEDEAFRIRTSSATDVRTASCAVTVDDPSMVKLLRKNSEDAIELEAGKATIVKFDPNNENEFILTPTGEKPLYKVVCDGTEVKSGGYSYHISVADGSKLDIQAMYPDVDCSLKLVFFDETSFDFLQSVNIDDRAQLNLTYPETVITTKLGAGLELKGDTDRYELIGFKVNGADVAFFNPFRLLLEGDTEIIIAAQKYASFDMTVVVDDPTRVHVYQGYSYNGIEYELKAGANTVEVHRDTPIISLVAADGCYLDEVNISGYDYEAEDLVVAPLMIGSLTSSDVLSVKTGVINRNLTAALYVEGMSLAPDFMKLHRADQSIVEGMGEGYNTFAFYERDNRFRLETGAPVASYVYLNDEEVEPEFPESPNYRPTLADGDVLKVFFGSAPSRHTLSIEVEPEAEGAFTLVRDRLRDISDTRGSLSALQNTELSVKPAADATLEVKVDGAPVAAGAEGAFSFAATGNHKVEISGHSAGIGQLDAAENSEARYFNLQGMRIETPRPGQTAIVVRGGKASKCIVK
ncbi:MAG: hypothetical protein K2M06_08320 [Muribaculaceae bacterium]|nr:hypothetical protein [Muribaculaceae bacterium]